MDTSIDNFDQQHDHNNECNKTDEEKFMELSTKTPIEYLNKYENAINGLLISSKYTMLSTIMLVNKTVSTILNNIVETDFGNNILENFINKIITAERWLYRFKEQFDINLNCPPFSVESYRPMIQAINTMYDTKLKEHIAILERKNESS